MADFEVSTDDSNNALRSQQHDSYKAIGVVHTQEGHHIAFKGLKDAEN